MRPCARTTAAALCTVAVLGPTACDTLLTDPDAKTPFVGLTGPEVVNKAVAATRSTTSMRIAVTTESADGPVQVFVAAGARGACTGTFFMGPAGTMELIRTGGTIYTKSDEAMPRTAARGGPPRQAEADVKRLTGRWVKARADDPRTAESLRYCEPRDFLDRLAAKSESARRGGRTTVNGALTLTLNGGRTAGKGGDSWTASVATEGRPYVLKMRISDSGAKPLTVEFSEFDKPFTVKRPAT
nr:hypothetical protein OG781_21480 [Streptomyces sp. NBC_00830]